MTATRMIQVEVLRIRGMWCVVVGGETVFEDMNRSEAIKEAAYYTETDYDEMKETRR